MDVNKICSPYLILSNVCCPSRSKCSCLLCCLYASGFLTITYVQIRCSRYGHSSLNSLPVTSVKQIPSNHASAWSNARWSAVSSQPGLWSASVHNQLRHLYFVLLAGCIVSYPFLSSATSSTKIRRADVLCWKFFLTDTFRHVLRLTTE